MSDARLVEFDNIGTLEEWNSDGLRSLIQTMPNVPDMIEKTLRYPGTIEYLRVLKKLGFFSEEPVEVDGRLIKPLDVTAKLLFPKWKMQPGDREFTVMRVTIKGVEEGKEKKYVYNLFDESDVENQLTSMARSTGYTCTGAAQLILNGIFNRKGVCPPEYIGEDKVSFKYLLKHLEDRNIYYKKTEL
jgi:lysine 6-dehydrogenase